MVFVTMYRLTLFHCMILMGRFGEEVNINFNNTKKGKLGVIGVAEGRIKTYKLE